MYVCVRWSTTFDVDVDVARRSLGELAKLSSLRRWVDAVASTGGRMSSFPLAAKICCEATSVTCSAASASAWACLLCLSAVSATGLLPTFCADTLDLPYAPRPMFAKSLSMVIMEGQNLRAREGSAQRDTREKRRYRGYMAMRRSVTKTGLTHCRCPCS